MQTLPEAGEYMPALFQGFLYNCFYTIVSVTLLLDGNCMCLVSKAQHTADC